MHVRSTLILYIMQCGFRSVYNTVACSIITYATLIQVISKVRGMHWVIYPWLTLWSKHTFSIKISLIIHQYRQNSSNLFECTLCAVALFEHKRATCAVPPLCVLIPPGVPVADDFESRGQAWVMGFYDVQKCVKLSCKVTPGHQSWDSRCGVRV